ncbi:hypothetical protein [Thiohalomonas denitrificans]|uniref:Uncharacterized protein n=1 Tax=Thiohalomonas denitrificans TaxID=415747 RepID=A0A1G5PSB4_9GAMM|nr:hypothetical protein [Thiohalomonas denitrificans]SCZ52248.1 hypothetical protein SAMN03097708_00707 [Thiohalomonas denitrificans]
MMTKKQRKLIEIWGVLFTFLTIALLLVDHPALARAMFIPLVIYGILNWQSIRSLEGVGPTPIEVIEGSSKIRMWLIAVCGIEVIVAISFLMTGSNLDKYLGIWSLLAAFLAPLLPALIASQLLLYRRLGKSALA